MSLSIYQIIIDKMLSYHNKTIYDLKNDSDFYYKNKLTSEQYFEWYEWSLNLLYQNFPNRKQADIKKSFDLFDIKQGLLYIHERPATIWSPEELELLKKTKQKKLGKDNTLKSFK
jgi:hypothetical protein